MNQHRARGVHVKAITGSGHLLRGMIEDFDDEAIYLKIVQRAVIIYKHSLHEFRTEGRPFKRQIEFFNKAAGDYGFIKFDGDPNKIFVHRSGLAPEVPNGFDSLRPGATVEFNIVQTATGLSARDVVLSSSEQ